jgi:hypothetical protein
MAKNSLITRPGALQAPQLDYFLVDGSGSMFDKWQPSLEAMDLFMDVLKSQNISSHGVVQVFSSHNLSDIQRDSTIENWTPFSREFIRCPGGMTPLYDAINIMCRSLRDDLDPPNASIVIVTDGDESGATSGGSTMTNAVQARALLDWCRAKGWQVTFLGCDFNNDRVAKLLGSNAQNTIAVRTIKLLEAAETLAKKRVNNVRTGSDINFSDDEKENFGGYLTHG